ncbi:hypothetical protein FLONG3_3646 [Fusarium longipes]|uniref:Uncharacterized protein n=1 Tax=Fusarium longipes TaxID=694270 RepID=A0A395T0M4_9HYPO|nr:hypothetical protein FLONG3_3646 [Fusarium longipes]
MDSPSPARLEVERSDSPEHGPLLHNEPYVNINGVNLTAFGLGLNHAENEMNALLWNQQAPPVDQAPQFPPVAPVTLAHAFVPEPPFALAQPFPPPYHFGSAHSFPPVPPVGLTYSFPPVPPVDQAHPFPPAPPAAPAYPSAPAPLSVPAPPNTRETSPEPSVQATAPVPGLNSAQAPENRRQTPEPEPPKKRRRVQPPKKTQQERPIKIGTVPIRPKPEKGSECNDAQNEVMEGPTVAEEAPPMNNINNPPYNSNIPMNDVRVDGWSSYTVKYTNASTAYADTLPLYTDRSSSYTGKHTNATTRSSSHEPESVGRAIDGRGE